jgi:Amidase
VDEDLAFAGPGALGQLVRSHEATPRELVELFLARIEALDPRLNAFRTTLGEQALAEADAAPERGAPSGALAGVPVAVKDDLAVAGQVATRGTRPANWPSRAASDAEPVRRLRAAGDPDRDHERSRADDLPLDGDRRQRHHAQPVGSGADLADVGHEVVEHDPAYGLAQLLFAQIWVRGIYEDTTGLPGFDDLERSTRQMAAAGRILVPDRRRASLLRGA